MIASVMCTLHATYYKVETKLVQSCTVSGFTWCFLDIPGCLGKFNLDSNTVVEKLQFHGPTFVQQSGWNVCYVRNFLMDIFINKKPLLIAFGATRWLMWFYFKEWPYIHNQNWRHETWESQHKLNITKNLYTVAELKHERCIITITLPYNVWSLLFELDNGCKESYHRL